MKWTLPDGYRGLIFDCDGTLVDSMPLHYHAWTTVLNRHGLQFSEQQFYAWAGLPIAGIIKRLSGEQNLQVDVQQVADERDHYFHSLPCEQLRPVRAVVEIARHYHEQYPLAVATGSTQDSARASLEAIDILSLFDAIVSSQEVEQPKPAPDVFLLAAKRIGIPPNECVAFEDGDAGMQSAQKAGMLVVDIRPWLER
ncbi:MAG: HAD family hydrolase [Candidatus Latescibacterota bacterium]